MPSLSRPALVDYRNNGKKPKPTFSDAEMQRRQDGIRGWMAKAKVDAVAKAKPAAKASTSKAGFVNIAPPGRSRSAPQPTMPRSVTTRSSTDSEVPPEPRPPTSTAMAFSRFSSTVSATST